MKAVACALVAVVLALAVGKQEKDFAALIVLLACCMVVAAAAVYLEPVVSFFRTLLDLAQMDNQTLSILLKAVGIGVLAQVAALICTDAGNAALGKTVELLAAAVVLWLSIPLFQSLLDLLETILGEV